MKTLKRQDIIAALSLEQKVSLLSGKDFWQTQDIPESNIPSIYLADGPHGIRKQAAAAEHMGLNVGIPSTCYPTEATVANSWNTDLGEKVGSYLGKEAVARGVNVLLGPGINMKRNPLCGRNFEYFSEDPYLAGKMSAAYVRGIQSTGVAACVKHFAVSNQEWRVMSIDAVVDERTMREIYLTAFEIAVKEGGARSIMSAYNKVNGIHANENLHLMREILRDEWGYTGCVITNWGGSNDRVAGLIAGNELEMPGSRGESEREIFAALERGEIDEALIDENVDRLLDLILSTASAVDAPSLDFNVSQHHRVSQRVAEESIVLLKNEGGVLPLPFSSKVAVIGEFARNARYQGAGSSMVNPTVLDNTLDCFAESGIRSIGYEPGFERYGKPNAKKIKAACSLAAKADAVLLYLGLDEVSEAQGIDRPSMVLPDNQVALLDALFDVNPNIIVILSCGCAIEMPWIGKVKGLLHAYLSGQAGARAVLRVISGDVNPSGKLAETFPLRYEDTSSAKWFPGNERTVEYREGPFIGYRYFDTAAVEVLFPFGHGLSYTAYEYGNLTVTGEGVSFTLTNTGRRSGMEVAQLYVGKTDSAVFRAAKELKGFAKALVNSGETKTVTIPFDDKTFRYFCVETNRWEIEPGDYRIMIGASSRDIRLEGSVSMPGAQESAVSSAAGARSSAHNAPARHTSAQLPSYFSGQAANVGLSEFERLLGRTLPPAQEGPTVFTYETTVSECRNSRSCLARLSFRLIDGAYRCLRLIGRRAEANLIMMSVYHLPFRGISRLTGGKITMKMVDGLLLMANGKTFIGLFAFLRAAMARKRRS